VAAVSRHAAAHPLISCFHSSVTAPNHLTEACWIPLQHQRGPTAALPVLEAGLRLLLRLAAPGPDGSPAAAHRLFVLNALPRLAQVRTAGFGALTDLNDLE
jgi:hypothetical protein